MSGATAGGWLPGREPLPVAGRPPGCASAARVQVPVRSAPPLFRPPVQPSAAELQRREHVLTRSRLMIGELQPGAVPAPGEEYLPTLRRLQAVLAGEINPLRG